MEGVILCGEGSPKTMIVPFLRYLNIFARRVTVSPEYKICLLSGVTGESWNLNFLPEFKTFL